MMTSSTSSSGRKPLKWARVPWPSPGLGGSAWWVIAPVGKPHVDRHDWKVHMSLQSLVIVWCLFQSLLEAHKESSPQSLVIVEHETVTQTKYRLDNLCFLPQQLSLESVVIFFSSGQNVWAAEFTLVHMCIHSYTSTESYSCVHSAMHCFEPECCFSLRTDRLGRCVQNVERIGKNYCFSPDYGSFLKIHNLSSGVYEYLWQGTKLSSSWWR